MNRAEIPQITSPFEQAVSSQPGGDDYVLRLFVTGSTPRSLRAIRNIRAICDERLPGHYDLEVVDLYQHPEQAQPEQIVVAPTLLKCLPLPVRRLIGDLSNTASVLSGLGLSPRGPEPQEAGSGA